MDDPLALLARDPSLTLSVSGAITETPPEAAAPRPSSRPRPASRFQRQLRAMDERPDGTEETGCRELAFLRRC